MIRPNPLWTVSRPRGVAAWPDRARLIAGRVIGQWYALDRANGAVIWEHDLATMNYLTGFVGNVAICATIEGAWRAGVGACALDLASGEVLWTQPPSPFRVEDEVFHCVHGSVHLVTTGVKLRTETPVERFGPADMLSSVAWAMTRT